MPTGVHLAHARELLFDAADRVLARDGASGLTSRAVTTEAGVAKGVMHRHFRDFDTFLAELISDRADRLAAVDGRLQAAAGEGDVRGNLAVALAQVFTPLAVAIVALVIGRKELRERLRQAGAARFPLLAEGSAMVAAYLTAERELGRVSPTADIPTLSHTLIGAVHLLFTDRENGPPDAEALQRLVGSVLGTSV